MLSSDIVNSNKNFPDFIRNSGIISASSINIEKVFPKIGLPNFKKDVSIKIDHNDIQLDKVIHLSIKKFIADCDGNHTLKDLKGLELFRISKILYIFQELSRRLLKKKGLVYNNGTIKLTTTIPSYDGGILVKNGTDVFKLTKTLLYAGRKYSNAELVEPIEIANQFKKLKVVFTSDGIDGAWDIATMSMRGIKSCMRWNASRAPALIGSIIDPCCGILYLTNGRKTSYGSKMLFRALVRLVINTYSNEPALLVDRLYSSLYKNAPGEYTKLDQQIKSVFVKTIQQKIPNCKILEASKDLNLFYQYRYIKPDYFNLLHEDQRSYIDTASITYTDTLFSSYAEKIYKAFDKKKVSKIYKPAAKNKKTITLEEN